MSWLLVALASFFGAALSAMGMGGGGLLLIYLTAYAGMEQLAAQGINLVFFIPIALVAIWMHTRRRLIRWRSVPVCVAVGLAGVWCGSGLAMWIGSDLLSRLFGGFLLIIGVRELFSKPKKKN